MKKKVIKPFNMDEYQNGGYEVETKCGYHVNFLNPDVVCIHDADDHEKVSDYQVMAGLDTPMGKRYAFYTVAGKFYNGTESDLDLVLVEEQEIPSVTKEEVKEHLQWFVDNADHMIEGFGAKVYEKLLGMVVAMRIAYRNRDNGIIPDLVKEKLSQKDVQDAKQEDVNYCALKLEGLEEMPNEEFAKSYVKFAVSCVNDALGYSAKKRNAFGWKKVWDNQGYFGVIEQENAKKIIEKYPEFPFRICTTKVRQHHGEAEPEVHMD